MSSRRDRVLTGRRWRASPATTASRSDVAGRQRRPRPVAVRGHRSGSLRGRRHVDAAQQSTQRVQREAPLRHPGATSAPRVPAHLGPGHDQVAGPAYLAGDGLGAVPAQIAPQSAAISTDDEAAAYPSRARVPALAMRTWSSNPRTRTCTCRNASARGLRATGCGQRATGDVGRAGDQHVDARSTLPAFAAAHSVGTVVAEQGRRCGAGPPRAGAARLWPGAGAGTRLGTRTRRGSGALTAAVAGRASQTAAGR